MKAYVGAGKCSFQREVIASLTDDIIEVEFVPEDTATEEEMLAASIAMKATYKTIGTKPTSFVMSFYSFMRALDCKFLGGAARFTPDGLMTLLQVALE